MGGADRGGPVALHVRVSLGAQATRARVAVVLVQVFDECAVHAASAAGQRAARVASMQLAQHRGDQWNASQSAEPGTVHQREKRGCRLVRIRHGKSSEPALNHGRQIPRPERLQAEDRNIAA